MPDDTTDLVPGSHATNAVLRGVLRPYMFGQRPTERPETAHCGVVRCSRRTREGKPFCDNHLERIPYVQGVLERRRQLQLEVTRALDWGVVDVEGMLARDVINLVTFRGRMVASRMAVELGVPTSCLPPVVEALALLGDVTFTVKRGRDGKPVMDVTAVRERRQ